MTKQIEIDLSGDKLLKHQRKLITSKCPKSALICGRGSGKSYACAALVLLTLIRNKNVLVGGQRYETIKSTLYEEIKSLAQEWGLYEYIKWGEAPMMMTLGEAHVWFGTYESIDAVRGYSKVSLIVLDEMFLAPVNILSVWGPCMRATGGVTRVVGATTPRGGSLWNVLFADPKCDWEIIRAVTTDNTHITKEEYDLILSGIDNEQMYRQEILGEIASGLGNSAIIHLEDFPTVIAPTTDNRVIAGLDCAEGVNRDATAFVKRQGNRIIEMWKLNNIDHEETVRRIRESNKRLRIDSLNIDAAFSDYEYNILKYEMSCEQVNFARAASDDEKDKYANVRAQMYFNLAYHIKHGLCCDGFDLSGELKRQMCSIAWLTNNQGRLLITPKEELREALKMSTDIADALALTCLDRYTADDPVMARQNVNSREKVERYADMMGD